MARLKLYVFGSPRIDRDAQPVDLNLRKALALLIYLAVNGQPASRDTLATMLWPEGDGREGRARLRRTIHRLSQTIGTRVFDASETIRLNPDADIWIDCAAFRQHVTAGLPADPGNAAAPARLKHLQDATELYADDFLTGFTLPDSPAFDEWQFFQRESLRQLYGQALEQLVQAYRNQQAWEQATPYARKWVALDPLHEPAHQLLMRLYAEAGQVGAALRQYQECVRVLEAELGVPPEDATTALYEAIRTRQFATEASEFTAAPAPEPDNLEPHERYLAEKRVAVGGQGEVFRGQDRVTGQQVAIKWLKTDLADRYPDLVARFVREGTVLRRLNHPNIVGILDTFEHDGRYAIVMEYVPGGSLRALLEKNGQLPLDRVLEIGLELADALSRAHHLGIIHRDIKPENVLLASDGSPQLMDFGLARLEWEDVRLTQSGTIFGSPAYMSPEAIRGEELDARSDIWSLGVLLYELLAGRRPFDGLQITPVLAAIQGDPVPDLRQIRADTPASLVDLLWRMLVKERTQRLSSMRQAAAEIEAIRARRLLAPHDAPTTDTAIEAPTPPHPSAAASPSWSTAATVPSSQPGGSAWDDQSTPMRQTETAAQPAPFVGRAGEYQQLVAAIDQAVHGHGQVVLIEGEPGIGKSRLAQVAVNHAQAQSVRVLWQKCHQAEQALPYQVVIDLVGQMLAGWASDTFRHLPPAAIGELALLMPEIASRFPHVTQQPATLAEARQTRLFRALHQFVTAPVAKSPLMIVIDDLQWADQVTLQFLSHLARYLNSLPIILVGTMRTEDLATNTHFASAIDGIRREPHVTDIQLSRLSLQHVTMLIDMLPSRQSLTKLGEWLFHETDGNPFFLISILQSLQERQAGGEGLPNADWQSDSDPSQQLDSAVTLPDALRQSVRERLRRVPSLGRSLLDLAAVYGREFTFDNAQAISGAGQSELLDAFDDLLARQLLAEQDRAQIFDFSHDKIREVVYYELSLTRRVLLHRKIAAALQSSLHEQPGTLAEHFEKGELWKQAIDYLAQAAAHSRQLFAMDQALQFYERALALAEQHPDAIDRATLLDLHEQRGKTRGLVGGHAEEAIADMRIVLEAARQSGDTERELQLLTHIGQVYRYGDQYADALEYLKAAVDVARSSGNECWLADTLYHLGTIVWSQGQNDQALVYHQEAADICRRLGLTDLVAVQAFHGLGEAYFLAGRAEEAIALYEQSLELSRQIQDKVYESENLGNLSIVLLGTYGAADYDRSIDAAKQALKISKSANLEWHSVQILAPLGFAYGLRGEQQPALEYLNQGLSVAESIGAVRFQSMLLDMLGVLWREFGQLERAREAHERALELATRAGAGWWLPQIQANLAIDRIRLGDLAVEETLEQTLEHATRQKLIVHALRCMDGLAQLALAQHQPRRALEWANQLQELAQAGGLRELLAQARRWHGEALLALGEREQAATELEQALMLAEAIGRPWLEKQLHVALAATQAAEPFAREQPSSASAAPPAQAPAPAADPPKSSSRASLPTQQTAFVGRESDLAEVVALLTNPACRIVTLLGPGGSGKTRLSLATAAALDGFTHGIFFIPLASLGTVEHLPVTIGEHIRLSFSAASEPKQQLLDHLRDKRMLLVLDNFEHLIAGVRLLAEILQHAPRVKLLVTSRERLNLSSETVYTLGGLPYPEIQPDDEPPRTDEQTLAFSAMQLLLQHARMVYPGFDPQHGDVEAMAQICRMVQGMPLALVLAASWANLLSFAEIADEIAQSLDFLRSEMHDLPERQRSVRAAFDYSWRRLSDDERRAFMDLSVFRSRFTRQAAQAVTKTGLATLRVLANKSFLAPSQQQGYEIHELLRQFAAELLDATGTAAAIRDAHSTYYLKFLQQREADIKGLRQLEALDEIELDIDNIRAAWEWAQRQERVSTLDRALEALYGFFEMRSRYREGAQLFQHTRERLEPAPGSPPERLWGRIVTRQSILRAFDPAFHGQIEADTAASLAIAEQHDEQVEVALGTMALGLYQAHARHDFARAIDYFEQSFEGFCAIEDRFYVAQALARLGYCHGKVTGAMTFYRLTRQSLELARGQGNLVGAALALGNLAEAALNLGEYTAADEYCREAIAVANTLGRRASAAHATTLLGLARLLQGDLAEAQKHAQEGQALATEVHSAIVSSYALGILSMQAGTSEDYALAQQLGAQSLATPSNAFSIMLANWGLGIAACGLEDYDAARQSVHVVIDYARDVSSSALMAGQLPMAAIILARAGQTERAAELFELADTHRLSPRAWMDRWPFVAQLRAELQAALGTDGYQRARERAATLDLEEVVAALDHDLSQS